MIESRRHGVTATEAVLRILTGLALFVCAIAYMSTAHAHEGYHNTLQEAYQSAAAQESAWSTFCVSSLQAGHVLVDFSITETSTAFVTNGRCLRSSDGSQVVMGPASHMWQPGQGCVAPEQYDPASNSCIDWELECTARSNETNWMHDGLPGQQLVCSEGCTYGAYYDPDTQQSYFSTLDTGTGAWFGQCEEGTPEPTECTNGQCAPDADGDGTPDDSDTFPDDPTESTDSDGDGTGDNADHSPDDPTDGDDDGTGDETDNRSEGGGTCDAPPTCNGDGIQCNLLFQTWKTRCAAERTATNTEDGGGSGPGNGDGTASGGQCETGWQCSGDPVNCAVLQEQHIQRCAAEGARNGLAAEADNYGEDGDADSVVTDGSNLAGSSIDTLGFLTGGDSCPVENLEDMPGLDLVSAVCPGAEVAGLYVYLLGWISVAWILGRAASGSA